MPPTSHLTIRVTWWMQAIQVFFGLGFTIIAVISLVSLFRGSGDNLLYFILAIGLAYIGWANAFSTIQVSPEGVIVSVMYGRFGILWDEVQIIAQSGKMVALIGAEKRVVLSLAFAGQSALRLMAILEDQAAERKLPIKKDWDFPFTHRNARI
jgi:hypothetical protein